MGDFEVNIFPKFIDNALMPVAKEIGETFSDLINLARTPIIKAKGKRDLKLKKFLEDLDEDLRKIPEKKLLEPKASLIGCIFDDYYKYYYDEEYIDEYFRKLISASMNSDLAEYVHPLLVSKVKQLDSDDAYLLSKLVVYSKSKPDLDLFTFNIAPNKKGAERIIKHLPDLSELNNEIYKWFLFDYARIRNALINLAHLGLIERNILNKSDEDYGFYEYHIEQSQKRLTEFLIKNTEFKQVEYKKNDLLYFYTFTNYGDRIASIL